MDAKSLAQSVDHGVLRNPWVSRAGNVAFLGGVVVAAVRLAKGADMLTVLTVVLVAVGVVLMAAPPIRRWMKKSSETQSAEKRVHVQYAPDTEWRVVHRLGLEPTVAIYGRDGTEWHGPGWQHIDLNTTDIDLGQHVSGQAFLRGARLILRLNENWGEASPLSRPEAPTGVIADTARSSGGMRTEGLKQPGPTSSEVAAASFETRGREYHVVETRGKPRSLRFTHPSEQIVRLGELPATLLHEDTAILLLKRFTEEGFAIEEKTSGVRVRAEVYYQEEASAALDLELRTMLSHGRGISDDYLLGGGLGSVNQAQRDEGVRWTRDVADILRRRDPADVGYFLAGSSHQDRLDRLGHILERKRP